jgi:translation initiation factor 2A
VITADESYLFRPTSSDLLIYTPALAPRPATRLKVEGQIKGLFLSNPQALPEGTTTVQPVKPHSEPALAVWVGEKKGAPATVSLYPISALVSGAKADAEKTEPRDMPSTTARKAFYKADKLQVKWSNAGTMVSATQEPREMHG